MRFTIAFIIGLFAPSLALSVPRVSHRDVAEVQHM